MRQLLTFSLLILFFSCDDGDIQIEEINFDETDAQFCGSTSDEKLATTFLFKILEDEALLLTLAAGQFANATTAEGSTNGDLSAMGTPSLTYRFFSGTVNKDYFCNEVPALEPTVVKENAATGGTVSIASNVTQTTETTKTYIHSISITDLSLLNDQEQRLTDLSTLEYGNFTTETLNSASLEVPFSNYEAATVAGCDASSGQIPLYKTANDEFIRLTLSTALLANAATGDNPRTAEIGTEAGFTNIVLSELVTEELVCSTAMDADIVVGDYTATAGTISVSTIENAPDSEGVITFTHTITLTDVTLVLQSNTEGGSDVTLDVVPSIAFGTVTTISG